MKEYEYKISATFEGGGKQFFVFVATTEREARNKFKESFPKGKIISCVRGCERSSQSQKYASPKKTSSDNHSEASSGGKVVVGLLGLAGGFLASKLFK
ncbi:hypothetical protein [Rodentibacter myodis]|uniref:Uncharacterized protein n=1 Tax=Rodentibacter myodis TaxID=1907939 RepID=A0A1V3JLM5_9PAST|nr:hypothetical protein [Rodentibacter myodis]OOF57565.1 hypothetical protein BKL49_08765 [Rodentibacter myodis]